MMAFSARAFAFNGGSNKGYSHALVSTVNVLYDIAECSPMIHVVLLYIDYCLSLSLSLSLSQFSALSIHELCLDRLQR